MKRPNPVPICFAAAGLLVLAADPVDAQCRMSLIEAPAGRQWATQALALEDDTLVVGAVHRTPYHVGPGCAYVDERSGSSWTEKAVLRAPLPVSGDSFGVAVSQHQGRRLRAPLRHVDSRAFLQLGNAIDLTIDL